MTATTSAPVSPWDRFFFRAQSTAPMTLVRVAWGMTATVCMWCRKPADDGHITAWCRLSVLFKAIAR